MAKTRERSCATRRGPTLKIVTDAGLALEKICEGEFSGHLPRPGAALPFGARPPRGILEGRGETRPAESVPSDRRGMAMPAELPPDAVPVAKARKPRAQSPPAPAYIPPIEETPKEALFSPAMLKGLSISLAVHAALLIALAVLTIAHGFASPKAIEGAIDPLGDPNGLPGGTTLAMGGIDSPTPMPVLEGVVVTIAPAPLLEKFTPAELKPDPLHPRPKPSRTTDDPDKAGAGDQPTNPGKGGGTGGDGFGVARFGSKEGSNKERVQGVEVKVGDPQFTLIWDSPADLDLHVVEPGGSEIFWVERRGEQGGELDVDNMKGFGPENIYWVEDRDEGGKVLHKGQGPTGEYKWFVVHYGGNHGDPVAARWKVRVKHNGVVEVFTGTLRYRQRTKTYTLKFDPRAGGQNRAGGAEDGRG